MKALKQWLKRDDLVVLKFSERKTDPVSIASVAIAIISVGISLRVHYVECRHREAQQYLKGFEPYNKWRRNTAKYKIMVSSAIDTFNSLPAELTSQYEGEYPFKCAQWYMNYIVTNRKADENCSAAERKLAAELDAVRRDARQLADEITPSFPLLGIWNSAHQHDVASILQWGMALDICNYFKAINRNGAKEVLIDDLPSILTSMSTIVAASCFVNDKPYQSIMEHFLKAEENRKYALRLYKGNYLAFSTVLGESKDEISSGILRTRSTLKKAGMKSADWSIFKKECGRKNKAMEKYQRYYACLLEEGKE